jgi:murein DD-endopeptidase MepM/ murein hydrolase activator NlpD
MEQIKYQGYARERGFNPTQMSTASVEAIGQQGNSLLRQMKDNSDIERRNRDAYQSQVQQNQQIESQNRSENYQFDKRSRDMYQQGVLRNMKTSANNALIESEQTQKTLGALSAFSGTIAKAVTAYQKKKFDDELNAEYTKTMLSPDPVAIAANQAGYTALQQSSDRINTIADQFEDQNVPAETVHQIRNLSRGAQAGRIKALSQLAILDYPGWLEEKFLSDDQTKITIQTPEGPIEISPRNHTGSAQRDALNRALMPQFLKEKGLFGVKSEFLAEALLGMRKAETSLNDRAREDFIKSANNKMLDDANLLFEAELKSDPITAFQNGLTSMRHLKVKGERLDWNGARDYMIERIVDIGDLNALETIRNSPHPLFPNKKWGDLHEDLFNDAADDIQDNQIKVVQRQETELRQEGIQVARNIISQFAATPPSRDDAEKLIKAYVQKYGSNSDLESWALKYNADAIDEEATKENLTELAERGLLTESDLNRPEVPLAVRSELRSFVQRRTDAINAAGGKASLTAIKEKIEGKANWFASKGSPKDYTIGIAVASAERKFNDLVSANLKGGMTAKEAVVAAERAIFADIDDPKGKYVYNQTAPGGEGFKSFEISPGIDGNQSAIDRRNYIKAKFNGGGNAAIERYPLIPATILKQSAEAYKRTGKIDIPAAAEYISQLTGGKVSPLRVLSEQINLYNKTAPNDLPPIQPPNVGGPDSSAGPMSPQLQRILQDLQYMPTRETVNRAAFLSGSAPRYIREGPGGFQDVMSLAASQGFQHPALAAAQWALESGYGSAKSGKNNVFGIKGPGTTVQTKEQGASGLYSTTASFRNYNSTVESAQDYIRLLSDSRYRAVGSAATPRQAAQAVKDAGYATDANYVSKLLKIMRDNGINPDVPFVNPTGSRWHQPGVANPRLTNAVGRQLLSQTQKTSSFGSQESFRKNPHQGNDYAVQQGANMSLSRPGRVVNVITEKDSNHGGYGGMVEIEFDDGKRTRVAHLSKVFVKPGDMVSPKKVFAQTGGKPGTPGAGRSTGPHVHLEKVTDKGRVDPTPVANRFYIDS